jgi:hypothetical protein
MVLVGPSVRIRALANRAPFAAQLHRLLEADSAVGHELVFGEFLAGDSGGRRRVARP